MTIETELPAVKVKALETYQDRVAAAHHALFHDDPTDVEERRARFFEEATETVQAFGMTTDDMHKIVNYSGNRPVGEPAKEIGAAMVTLASLCVIAGFDLMACAEADLEKLQRPETIDRIRAKRATRHGRGPLPGFDPALTLKDDPGNGGEAEPVTQEELSHFIRDKAESHKGMLQPDFWPFLAMYLMEEFSIRRGKGSEADG